MKKLICVLLCLALCAVLLLPATAAETKNYLLLGDSITEGFGVANPDEASYGKIVADTNGWNYANQSRMARNSTRMLELLNMENTYLVYDVKQADIISLSIGANDYLANDEVVSLVAGALIGVNDKKLDEIADGYYENLCKIIDRIYALNPDVTILIQYVYNAWSGFAATAFSAGADRVNATIDKYMANNPGKVLLCDISPAMNGHPEYLADDCVHPNKDGNIAIARVVLARMYELGLCENTEPVVLAEGINYNYFKEYISKVFGGLITILVKMLTGNAQNIVR